MSLIILILAVIAVVMYFRSKHKYKGLWLIPLGIILLYIIYILASVFGGGRWDW